MNYLEVILDSVTPMEETTPIMSHTPHIVNWNEQQGGPDHFLTLLRRTKYGTQDELTP